MRPVTRVLVGVSGAMLASGPCRAAEPGEPAQAEYRLGVDLFAASFGALVPLAPGWKIGGAGGLGFSLGLARTTIDGYGSRGMADLLRAEALVSRELGSHAWLDLGIAAAVTVIAADGELLIFGSSFMPFVEPLVGWSFLRFGTRVSAGYWINLDEPRVLDEPGGFAVCWKPITLKVVW